MNFKWILLLILIVSIQSENAMERVRVIRKRQASGVDLNKVMGFLDPSSTVKFISVVGLTQFIVAMGWIVSGIIWSLLMGMSQEGSGMSNMLSSASIILSPTSASINVLRCLTGFVFLALGFLFKTLLTVGFGETIGLFKTQPLSEMITSLLSSRKFILGAIGRAILGSIFQLLVFASFYVFVAKKQKKRRRKRSWTSLGEDEIQMEYLRIVQNLQNIYFDK